MYLFVHDGEVEVRDASAIWGKTTGQAQTLIRDELGDRLIRTAQCGPAGEKLISFTGVCNDLTHFVGRGGLGAVMGSKKLKAIAVRGRTSVPVADKEKVRGLAQWMNEHWKDFSWRIHDTGSGGGLLSLNASGGLPTRNFREGQFEGAAKISGDAMKESILVGRETCYACPIQCKRVVEAKEPYVVDRTYGGPEYETLGAFGSMCGVDNLVAVAKAHEICNATGLDTISAGVTVAFAMECFENGIITLADTDGIDLRFGNADAMVKVLQKIVDREGIGDLLAKGTLAAAKALGRGAEEFAMQVRGQEIPMHEPRLKWGLGVGYATSVTGADHCHNMHDVGYTKEGKATDEAIALGAGAVPVPAEDLSAEKMALLRTIVNYKYCNDSMVVCTWPAYSPAQYVDLVTGVTGWQVGTGELVTVGERAHVMARLFNLREGLKPSDEVIPKRFFKAFSDGPLAGKVYSQGQWDKAKTMYYNLSGWTDDGVPTDETLARLGLRWAREQADR